jgi:hypothetical protein
MWEPKLLTTLWASMACNRDMFIFIYLFIYFLLFFFTLSWKLMWSAEVGDEWAASFCCRLNPGERPPPPRIILNDEDAWASEPVWTMWTTGKYPTLSRIRNAIPRSFSLYTGWAVAAYAVCNWGNVRRLLTPWCILTVTVFLMDTADKEAHYPCSGLSTRFTLIKVYLVRLVDKQS